LKNQRGAIQRIRPIQTWHDLPWPKQQLDELRKLSTQIPREVLAQPKQRFTLLLLGADAPGFTDVLASELSRDLLRIDLSQIISKYIGETERQLDSAFDAATRDGAALLFDEADALFSRRSEIKGSHDRFRAQIAAYFLCKMAAFDGFIVLASRQQLDDQRLEAQVNFTLNFMPAEESGWDE